MTSRLMIITALAALAVGCGRQVAMAPRVAPGVVQAGEHARATHATTDGAQHFEGEIGPGALYAIDVPADWNHDLVAYAHGYTLPQLPVAIPNAVDGFGRIHDLLLARGYAVAVTSFSSNGYAVAEGARQVHQLRGLFTDLYAAPRRTFIMGQSLGGLIGLELAETHASEYAGALLVSGVVGGTRAEINYVGDMRVIFDTLWPNVLGGTVTDVPNRAYPQDSVVQAVLAHQERVGAQVCTFRDPGFRLAGRNGQELVTSLVRVLGFQWLAGDELFDRTHEHQLYDNHDASYLGCAPAEVLAGVNHAAVRYTATPDAIRYMLRNYEPSGVLRIPVLTLHAQHDPVVPSGHEDLLLARATATGSLGQLLQCRPNRYGHTEAFRPDEVVASFDALVAWANTGIKPDCPLTSDPD